MFLLDYLSWFGYYHDFCNIKVSFDDFVSKCFLCWLFLFHILLPFVLVLFYFSTTSAIMSTSALVCCSPYIVNIFIFFLPQFFISSSYVTILSLLLLKMFRYSSTIRIIYVYIVNETSLSYGVYIVSKRQPVSDNVRLS